MVGNVNVLGMGQLGSKSPNLQSPPNVQSSIPNNLGVGMGNSLVMSMASNGNVQPMNSMQSKIIIMIY